DARFDCDLLVERHLLHRRGDEFLFAHALIRDAAYATLLKQHRRQLHRSAAEWLRVSDPPLAAEHLVMAGDPGAAGACLAAAEDLIRRFRYAHALALIDRGLSVSGGDRLPLLLARGDALLLSGAAREAVVVFAEAQDAALRPRDACLALLG